MTRSWPPPNTWPPIPPPSSRLLAGEIVDLVCRASEIIDESVELHVLKCLLTAVSSKTFRVHGRALLRVVRTCYNVFLGSKSEVNQSTAKASLTQMLTVVFHRLEAGSSEASAPAIVVADLLRPSEKSKPSDGDGVQEMVNFVQSFVGKVIADMNTVTLTTFGGPDAAATAAAAAEREMTEGGEFDDDADAAEDGDGTSAGTPLKRSLSNASSSSSRRGGGGGLGLGLGLAARTDESFALESDAFLVFRALCKLAKKSGDLANVSVVRGKTLSLELLKILLENAGPRFYASERCVEATKEYLLDAVATNAAPSVPTAYQLSLSIFLTLLRRFRVSLKSEIGFFFPMLMLKPLEVVHGSPLAPYPQRAVLLSCLNKLCGDARLLVDLFVNFDCDLGAFYRMHT